MTIRSLKIDAPVWSQPALDDQEEWSLQIRIITPMFGGGYEPREIDQACPIRVASIRGQLRFWWRAIVGVRYATPQELFKAEEDVWGSASMPGKVALHLEVLVRGETKPCAEFQPRQDGTYPSVPIFLHHWPPYALMPFQGNVKRGIIEEPPAKALVGSRVQLHIKAPVGLMNDVRKAIAGWVQFGGIGARTRRGCGSLACEDGVLDVKLVRPTERTADLTILNQSRYVRGKETNNPVEAWREAVEIYQAFRQKVGFARNEGQRANQPGRSFWPEADSIRRLSGHNAPEHPPQHRVHNGFPRADLGLPIIFHYKDDRKGDPKDTTLAGPSDTMRRFASPVITKALQVGSNRYRPLVLVLNAPHVWHYGDLRLSGGASAAVRQNEIELPVDRINVRPMAGHPAREALLRYVAGEWMTRIEALP